MGVDIKALVAKNQSRYDGMTLDPARIPAFDAIARKLCAPDAKARFQAVTTRLQSSGYQPVPWWFTGIAAVREYGGPPIWNRQLGQGDPLGQVSRNEPAGRGPFLDHPGDDINNNAWLRCCLDALIDCAPHAAIWHDWTPGGVATIFEEYNGLGYAARGVPSAYVWSGSNQYVTGKYVADHVYSAGTRDVQEGCMPILKRMMVLDKSITLAATAGAVIQPPKPVVLVPTLPPDPKPHEGRPGVVIVPPVPKHRGLIGELLDAFEKL